MHRSRPSRTAYRVALRRAAHQVLDDPPVFKDPLALSIVGSGSGSSSPAAIPTEQDLASRSLRAFMAVRSRYAEDQLAAAVAQGVRQYVLLGAGLDTFAYRNPFSGLGLRVFEVDHPATQAWKRDLLVAAQIAIPSELAFAPVDFETQTLRDGLDAVGFRTHEPAFFSWLGVTPYLTREAFEATLQFIAALPPLSGVVFDYAVARASLSFLEQRALDALARRVAAAGEPFQLFFDPTELAQALQAKGFAVLEDLDTATINFRYFAGRTDGLKVNAAFAHLLFARVQPKS
jgi:methyltransferase (TIGR00027 family)